MASSWSSLSNLPSLTNGFNPDTMLLLTDGSVLVHNSQGANGGKEWFRLTPDDQGHYDTGTWSGALNMTNTRIFFASGVLMDGRLFVVGGEFSSVGGDTPLGEIFDPSTNAWGPMNKPAAFNFIQGDCSACVLPDGRVIFGDINSQRSAIWDPVIDQWVESGFSFGTTNVQSKQGKTNEETWTLLPDGTVLAVETFNPNAAEKYLPSQDRWVSANSTLAALPITTINDPSNHNLPVNVFEIGPAVMLPNGKLFAIGATGHTGLYTPPASDPTQAGTWANGPDFPSDTSGNGFSTILTCSDGAAVVLPGGKVLCMAGSLYRYSANGVDFFSNPTTFFLFDPANTASLPQFSPQPSNHSNDTWTARLLLLPNGDVFFTDEANRIQMLTPDASLLSPDASWKPIITNAPTTLNPGHTYTISGRQLNGLTQANSYGDDAQMATNFPLVRLTNTSNNKVHYLTTSNFSTMGIATGSAVVTANMHVPTDMPPGQYNLVVVANAISSDPVTVNVAAQDIFLIIDRSTYGQGEIQALINLNGAPAVIDPALYVVAEGFSPNDLGLNSGNLSSPPHVPSFPNPDPKISLTFSGAVIPQDPALHPTTAQRFTFPFKINFQDASMFNFSNPTDPLTIVASLTAAGNTVAGGGVITLIKNPNPFILHGDVTHGYDWYLSVDIRVFMLKAGDTHFGAHVATSGSARTVGTTFIQQAVHNLNGSPGSAGTEFDALPEGEDTSTLALATTDSHGTLVYNFALARVRYRDVQDASNVRLFFRMWPAQQTNATYDTNTTYRSGTNGTPGHLISLLGVQGDEIMTIPFFATPRIDATSANMKTQTDTFNVAPVIHPDTLGGEVDTYFGAWLDINQPNEKLFPARMLGNLPQNLPDGPFVNMGPLLSIQELVRSEHQCLLAEISFDPDPIPSTADPSTSDKLAQRNLTFVNVPNPGHIASRRAPQTFEVRPTPIQLPAVLGSDELMIEWGNTPHGSVANIYLPAVPASQIIDMANQIYSDHRLTKADAWTIQCPTGGVTYIPIPKAAGPNFASLLTIDLPDTVKKGQVYNIAVRQITSAAGAGRIGVNRDGGNQPGKTQPARRRTAAAQAEPAAQEGTFATKGGFIDIFWRRVLGKFQLTIPVSTKQELLAPEERRLSILRWIEKSIPAENRWYKPFGRYVDQTGERVRFMGGDPDKVKADPNGDWNGQIGDHDHDHDHEHEHEHGHEHHHEHEHPEGGEERLDFWGKISGLVYDRFGDFDGFLLDTEDGERRFVSREERVEALAAEAWEDRLLVSVVAELDSPERPLAIVLRGGKEE